MIFLNADPDRGFAPMAGELRIGADFFIFLDLGWCGLAVRMGGERRFASLMRIAAPHEIKSKNIDQKNNDMPGRPGRM